MREEHSSGNLKVENGQYAILCQTKNRDGCMSDVINIQTVMNFLKILPILLLPARFDLTKNEATSWSRSIAEKCENFDTTTPLFVFVMGHGNENGILDATERQTELFTHDQIIQELNTSRLKKRLKIIVFVACRGIKEPHRSTVLFNDGINKRNLENFFIMYTCEDGYVSKRNPTTGVPFIEAFCQELKLNFFKQPIGMMFENIKMTLRSVDLGNGRYCLTPDKEEIKIERKFRKRPLVSNTRPIIRGHSQILTDDNLRALSQQLSKLRCRGDMTGSGRVQKGHVKKVRRSTLP